MMLRTWDISPALYGYSQTQLALQKRRSACLQASLTLDGHLLLCVYTSFGLSQPADSDFRHVH